MRVKRVEKECTSQEHMQVFNSLKSLKFPMNQKYLLEGQENNNIHDMCQVWKGWLGRERKKEREDY